MADFGKCATPVCRDSDECETCMINTKPNLRIDMNEKDSKILTLDKVLDTERLKPCPFCGTAPVGPHHGDSQWWIECQVCEVSMKHQSKSTVIQMWNRRVI